MKKSIFFILIIAGLSFSAYGQTKNEDIIKLLELMDVKSQAGQTLDLMLPSFIQLLPDVPAVYWNTLKDKLNLDSFMDIYVPIYDKYFTQDDIKQLIEFYESPIGKKLIEQTPSIINESYAGGQAWGQQIGEEIVNELIKDGYIDS
ncbi:MAG: DUF2059 domain-containing protein [Treponema sp.]|nr:DUF2059 domain-containing protein [Treponema sp.]